MSLWFKTSQKELQFIVEDKKSQQYKDVDSNGRNGGMTTQTAYKGTKKNVFYRTPAEFFEGDADTGDSERDPADTSKVKVNVALIDCCKYIFYHSTGKINRNDTTKHPHNGLVSNYR